MRSIFLLLPFSLPRHGLGPLAPQRLRGACGYTVVVGLCALAVPAGAQESATAAALSSMPTAAPQPRRIFIDGARAASDVGLVSVGVQWPWGWHSNVLGGELTGHWDTHIAHWRVPEGAAAQGRRQWTQLAVVPTLRLRFDGGRSAWFMEGGIGVSVLDGHYATRHKTFSTRFNFSDHQGVGFNFGAERQHELVLVLRHVSNGGIRKPNPGEDFVQVRYSRVF